MLDSDVTRAVGGEWLGHPGIASTADTFGHLTRKLRTRKLRREATSAIENAIGGES